MTIFTEKQNIIISWSQTVNISTCRFKTAIDSASLSTKMYIFLLQVLQVPLTCIARCIKPFLIEYLKKLRLIDSWFRRNFALKILFYYDLSWQFAFGNSSISHLGQLALLKWRFISGGFVCTHLNINLMGHKLCLRAGTLSGMTTSQVLSLLIFSLASTNFDTYN